MEPSCHGIERLFVRGLSGKGESLSVVKRVVVVEGLPETAAVLKAVLEPRGIAVSRCRRHRLWQRDEADTPPELLVLHEDVPGNTQTPRERSDWECIPRVIIGPSCHSRFEGAARGRIAAVFSSLFEYGELLGAIEQLLRRRSALQDESPAEEGVAAPRAAA